MRISDWSSDVCSSDLLAAHGGAALPLHLQHAAPADRRDLVAGRHRLRDGDAGHADVHSRDAGLFTGALTHRSEEQTSELQSLMRISYAVFCLKKKKNKI